MAPGFSISPVFWRSEYPPLSKADMGVAFMIGTICDESACCEDCPGGSKRKDKLPGRASYADCTVPDFFLQ